MKPMINRVIFFLVVISVFSGCLKNQNNECKFTPTNNVAPAGEQAALQEYLDTNHIEATKHPNGFFYNIVSPGTKTDSLGVCSQIHISYSGKFTNGNQFDSNGDTWFTLGVLIDGWKYGIPLIGKGGRIKLYIPPSLGYGATDVKNGSVVVIPANSILIFDISMSDYTKQN